MESCLDTHTLPFYIVHIAVLSMICGGGGGGGGVELKLCFLLANRAGVHLPSGLHAAVHCLLADTSWNNLFLFFLFPNPLWMGCPLLICFYGTLLKSMLMVGRRGEEGRRADEHVGLFLKLPCLHNSPWVSKHIIDEPWRKHVSNFCMFSFSIACYTTLLSRIL